MPFTTEAELVKEIRETLGEPTVKVELDTTQIVRAIGRTKRWFAAKKGIRARKIIPVVPGQQEYLMTDDVENVIDVFLEATPDLIAFFSIGFFDVLPFGFPFAFPTTPSTLQYSGYVQLLQFNEIRKRIFSIEASHDYFQQDRLLTITPRPVVGGGMLIEYKSAVIDITKLFARDEQLFFEHVLAQSKIALGAIRRKYAEYPIAGGSTSMDGDALIADGKEDMERLNQEIFDSQGAMSFLVG